MNERIILREVEREIAQSLIKGKKLHPYCLSNIANGKFSIENIVNFVLGDKEGQKIFENEKEIIKKIESYVCERKNLSDIVNFAQNVPNASIDKLCDIVIKTKRVKNMYNFIRELDNVSIDKFVEAIMNLSIQQEDEYYLELIYNLAFERQCSNYKKLWDKFIEIKSMRVIYQLALKAEGKEVNKFLDVILANYSPKEIYKFICLKQADIEDVAKVAEVMINLNADKYIYLIAKNFDKAPQTKLIDKLIEMESPFLSCWLQANPKYQYRINEIIDILMARCKEYEIGTIIPYLSDEVINNVLIRTKSTELLYKFAKIKDKSDEEQISNAMIEFAKYEDAKWLYEYIINVGGVNKEKIIDKIIELNNPRYILYIAKNVENAPLEKMKDAIIKERKHIYSFAEIIGFDNISLISSLIDEICKIGDSNLILEFACRVKGNLLNKLAEAILKTKDCEAIYSFMKIEGVPREKLIKTIVNIQ